MARKSRKYQKFKFFHVMVQGIEKKKIFDEDVYKFMYSDLIYVNSKRANIDIIAYCIMNNHVHLVIYTPQVDNMISFFRYTNTSFARRYNSGNKRVGYVFRDRYKSKGIRNTKQLIATINYVHNNPIKAKFCEEPQNYEFSSYNEYFNIAKIINKTTLHKIFRQEDFNEIFKL